MRIARTLLPLAIVADVTLASTWFSKSAYNKWHETELERWLADHDIPFPTPADRKDLEKTVEQNWNAYVVQPYNSWTPDTLQDFLRQKGVETKDAAASGRDALVAQVKDSWYESEDRAEDAYAHVKDWILDTWTDSQLKAFADHHAIPVPQPRTRDTLLSKARENYDAIAKKADVAASYPGDWLYDTWTESDFKEWLDTYGIPAPQPTTRDKLIATVRRNSRLAYLKAQDQLANANANAQSAYNALTDKVIDAWSESDLKDFCDKNAIRVPQGSKVDEVRALVRKHRAELLGDTISGTAASAFGAATSSANNQYARATNDAALAAQKAFGIAIDTWSESRLKGFLDARGVPVPQASTTDDLRALVRKHSTKVTTNWNAWTFDDFTAQNLKHYLTTNGNKAAKQLASRADASREELISAANSAYASASKAGGDEFASATKYLTEATDHARKESFDTWAESDLKDYLDSYGVPVPQGTKVQELRALARKHANYYKHGIVNKADTSFFQLVQSIENGLTWALEKVGLNGPGSKRRFTDEL